MSGRTGVMLGAVAVGVALLACPSPAGAKPRVPPAFHGVVVQSTAAPPTGEILRLSRAGTVRFVVPWHRIEPVPGSFRWEAVDRLMLATRQAGARPLPFVFGTPSWLGGETAEPPLGSVEAKAAFGRFLRELVRRYGPDGEWTLANPGAGPVRRWQIWNEPNLYGFWKPAPSPPEYADLLRHGAAAIRAVDPGARIVLAGLAPARRGIKPWAFIARLLRQPGAARSFDILALNPYAASPRESRRQAGRVVRSARRAGMGRKPTMIAEIGWGSAGPRHHPLSGSPRTQARRVRTTYRLLAERRRAWRLRSVMWYSLQDRPIQLPYCSFCNVTGLLTASGGRKPAWRAFLRSARVLR